MLANLKYALYTGCTAKESTPELLKSTLAIAKRLDIELIVLEEASCCGASHLQDVDEFLSIVLNARNICYAQKLGLDLLTICNTCQLNTSATQQRLNSDDELRARVNEKLKEVGLEYKKDNTKVRHFLYALEEDLSFDTIKSKVEKPLSEINLAPFYGCHNIRPMSLQQKNNGNERAYAPKALESLIVALGGVSIDYESKNRCCGFHVELQNPKTANRLSGTALSDAIDSGADAIVTPCPLCHLRMDTQQKSISKEIGRDMKIPILHFPQIVGLALGISKDELGLNQHIEKV
jgi:succinate dehydrogenase / fumarate reductase cytochrome b subunit